MKQSINFGHNLLFSSSDNVQKFYFGQNFTFERACVTLIYSQDHQNLINSFHTPLRMYLCKFDRNPFICLEDNARKRR